MASSPAARARVRPSRVGRAAVEHAQRAPPAASRCKISLSGARAPRLFSPGRRAGQHAAIRAGGFCWRGDLAAELGSASHRRPGERVVTFHRREPNALGALPQAPEVYRFGALVERGPRKKRLQCELKPLAEPLNRGAADAAQVALPQSPILRRSRATIPRAVSAKPSAN